MLKTLRSTPASSTSRTHKSGEERNEVEKLQERLNSLRQKSFKVHRLAHGGQHGLIDSGATNPFKVKKDGRTS